MAMTLESFIVRLRKNVMLFLLFFIVNLMMLTTDDIDGHDIEP